MPPIGGAYRFAYVGRSVRPSVGGPNGFRPITRERLDVGSSNITWGHPRGQGGNLSILGIDGQRSRSQALKKY